MQPRFRLTTALALATGVAAFALPAAANAAVTTTFDPATKTLTFTGDAGNDNVTLGVDQDGHLTHNFAVGAGTPFKDKSDFNPDPAVENTLPSNGSIAVDFEGGGGNDTVNLSVPDLANSTLNGGPGDDIIVGSDNVDQIDGGIGNDRITGFKGSEVIHGGPGNDVMIWQNGDGNDTNVGDGGVDETQVVEGTGDDDNRVIPSPTAPLIRFERTGAGPFTVDMDDIDRLSLQSFSGNDKLATAAGIAIPMVIDAGSGADDITTGDGADLINGGDDNDTLNGAGGGDRLVGDRGADTDNGGAGDDTMVWNNGDGNDVMNGDDGLDRVEDNLSAADEVSTLRVENGRTRYDRLGAGAFNLSMAAEVFELNTLGGNDTLTTSPGVPMAVVADGGAGNDAFDGGDEADTYFGGLGDDRLSGGNGADALDGQDGNDTLLARDDVAELVRGGAGTDTAVVDAADAVDGVEAVDRPATPQPTPAPAAGAAALAKTGKVKKGIASLSLSCPAGTSGCKGNVTLLTAKALKLGKFRAPFVLGRASYSLKAGEKKVVRLRLAPGTRALARKKRLAVNARVFSEGAPERSSKLTLSFK